MMDDERCIIYRVNDLSSTGMLLKRSSAIATVCSFGEVAIIVQYSTLQYSRDLNKKSVFFERSDIQFGHKVE